MSAPRAELAADLYTEAAIRDPHPLYRAIRDLAPAVWLPAHQVWALGRFGDVRAALRADEVLLSGRGVALNDLVNEASVRTTLASDGALHRRRRTVLMKPMMPSALEEVRGTVERLADELVADLVARRNFDGITDFARHLPVSVVAHLVGLPEQGRERMLEWAAATFDALGPWNARAQAGAPKVYELAKYALGLERGQLAPTGWAARLYDAADAGALDPEDVQGLIIDYVAPSLDTTILATGHLLFLLGSHPEQWERVRSEPQLASRAVHEALRFEAPVRGFTRFAEKPYQAGDVQIAAGERVLLLFGSANRDERHYPDPDRFDVTRDARDHVSFGHGVHRCAGGHLAQLELEALAQALVRRVRRIEVGAPEALISNVLRGWRSFPASFH